MTLVEALAACAPALGGWERLAVAHSEPGGAYVAIGLGEAHLVLDTQRREWVQGRAVPVNIQWRPGTTGGGT
ncbi:MAG: hypothetical protein Q7R32_14800 [Dehalococcoidia bacterium]|nr:hypothetical protein [Dehalococcoidia bacterium]